MMVITYVYFLFHFVFIFFYLFFLFWSDTENHPLIICYQFLSGTLAHLRLLKTDRCGSGLLFRFCQSKIFCNSTIVHFRTSTRFNYHDRSIQLSAFITLWARSTEIRKVQPRKSCCLKAIYGINVVSSVAEDKAVLSGKYTYKQDLSSYRIAGLTAPCLSHKSLS